MKIGVKNLTTTVAYCEEYPPGFVLQELEESIQLHQTTISNLNSAGSDIISQSSEPDSVILSEKLDSINRRWKNVCTEVSARKDRWVEFLLVKNL